MTDSMDDLIEHLLDKISLTRSRGFTAVDFEKAVRSFYDRKNHEIEVEEDKIITDEKLIESAFTRLSEHEDADIQDDDQTLADQQDDQIATVQSKLAGKRISTSEERLWQHVAGHEVDVLRIPSMEFELLVIIAQHGPRGILQPRAGELAGQDKRSIPLRTDKLADKGYITKSAVVAKHLRTSLLVLKKWATSDSTAVLTGGILHFDALFDTTIALLKDNGNIISIDDLYLGLDPKAKLNRKILLRSCQRLSQTGCTRLLRCRVQDEDGNPIMKAHSKEEKTVNAIQLLREPTADDKSIWVNFRNGLRAIGVRKSRARPTGSGNQGSGEDDDDDEEAAEDDDTEGGDEDAEGETDDEAMVFHSMRDTTSEMPPPDSTQTPSRQSNRARRKSSLAQSAEYARLFEEEQDYSDQDAEYKIAESASSDSMTRSASGTATTTPRPQKKHGRLRKTPIKDGSAVRSPARPLNSASSSGEPGGEVTGRSMLDGTQAEISTAAPGTLTNGETPLSSKRQRKKSSKALEADALRAAGEPLLTEPVDDAEMDDNSDAQSVDKTGHADSDDMHGDDVDIGTTPRTPIGQGQSKKSRVPRKKRDSVKKDKPQKKREPIVKKREIPPEEYEEYEMYAQAAAERQVRLEMKSSGKRTATMAGLDGLVEQPNKVARTDEQNTAEGRVEETEPQAVELPADRVAEVKASIIARERPGVYINPPGARNTKLENYVQRGRPRNAIIAVVKSDGLKEFSWFKDDGGPRFAPKASRRRTARIGEGLAELEEDKSPFFVEGSGSEVEEEMRSKKKRKVIKGEGLFRLEKKDGAPTAQPVAGPGNFGTLGLGLVGAAEEDPIQDDSEVQENVTPESTSLRRTSRISRRRSLGFDLAPIGSDQSDSPDAVEGVAGSSTPEDPIAAAKLEMAALQRKRGRPLEQNVIRMRVLQRKIDLDAIAKQKETKDSMDTTASVQGGNESVNGFQKTATSGAPDKNAVVDENARALAAEAETPTLEKTDAIAQPETMVPESGDETMSTQQPNGTEDVAVEAAEAGAVEATLMEQADEQLEQDPPGQTPVSESSGPSVRLDAAESTAEAEVENMEAGVEAGSAVDNRPAAAVPSIPLTPSVASAEDTHTTGPQTVDNERELVLNGSSSASVNLPRGLSIAHTSASFRIQDGNLQKPQHTTMLSVTAPSVLLAGLDAPETTIRNNTPQHVSTTKIQNEASGIASASEKPEIASDAVRQSSVVSAKPSTYPELRTGKSSSLPELFTKQYVADHPDEKFHYRGGGKYARGERFNQAYVDKHPNEKFYRVAGEGSRIKFARVEDADEAPSGSAAATVAALPAIDPTITTPGLTTLDAVDGATQQIHPSIAPGGVQTVSNGQDTDQTIAEQLHQSREHQTSSTVAEKRSASISRAEPESATDTDGPVLARGDHPPPEPQVTTPVPVEQTFKEAEVRNPITTDLQDVVSGSAEQSLRKDEPAGTAVTTHEQAATHIAAGKFPPAVEVDSPAPTPAAHASGELAQSGTKPRKRAKKQTKSHDPDSKSDDPDAPKEKRNDKWREKRAIDIEERFDKAYVTAHPDEHFYHRGKGWYSRGQTVTKEYVEAHPEMTFKEVRSIFVLLPAADSPVRERTPPPEVEMSEPLNQQLQSASTSNGSYKTCSTDYVENHPDETFYHRGGGRWYPGLPPAGSAIKTSVRGPGAELWKIQAEKALNAAILARAKINFTTSAGSATPPPASHTAVTPISSLLTIHKPYIPQPGQMQVSSPSRPAMAIGNNQHGKSKGETETVAATTENGDVEMTDAADEGQHRQRKSTASTNADQIIDDDGDIDMHEEGDDEDRYFPPVQDEDADDDAYTPAGKQHGNSTQPSRAPAGQQSQGKIFFPVDLSAAVIVRRTEKQKQQPAKPPPTKRRARLQTVSKSNDDHVVDLTENGEQQGSTKAAPRMPARGSKISRDIRLQSQRVWPYGVSPLVEMPAPASALLMHPAQSFHPETGTFSTAAEFISPPEKQGRRGLRPRASLAKLPQALEDDFCEAPGLIVKLKIKNLASVLPPDTAFESGLFATNAASDAVPVSRITGKPMRPYNRRSKKVSFQLDDSDGDEFQDDGEVEVDDEDDDSDELDMSDEENAAVARPERRKRSTGINGEIRIRDMASGPAFKDADRLVIAFALVAAVCGGLRVEGINWTLIAHALGFRYDGNFLRRRWDHFKRTRKVDVDKLREAIHEPFLAAYEHDDFPRVDFQNLNNTDWPALFDWVQAAVVPHVQLQPKDEGPKAPDLLRSRQETEEHFEIKEPPSLYEVRLDEYFVTGTEQNRRSLITKYTYGSALPGELRPKDQVTQDMALLRSWVRAVAVTKQYNYHPEAAAQKLRKFSPDMLQQVTAEMIENRTFSQERKSRMLPGRNYQISNECLQVFRRWPPRPHECRFLRFVAQAWKNINTHFQSQDQLSLVPSASDPEYLVLTNMSAQGLIRMSTTYPEIKNDYDAPYPKLSPWGYCGPTYETKKVDMSRLKFPIVYTKTAAYKDDHPLLNHVPIPLYPPQIEGEIGVRTPFWVDIHGNLIDDVWDMVLRSVLHLLVFRSGSTANMIEQAHGRKLWAWEIEMALEWMREVGIAERIGAGRVREDGTWSGGWRAGEWWYCAFTPEVARWEAPTAE